MFCDENYKATKKKKNQRFLTIMRSYEKNGWCPGEDSNLHGLHHTDLNRARLPIPPPGPRRSMPSGMLPAALQFQDGQAR